MLKISRNPLELWLKARAETGSFQAKRNYSRGLATKIQNLEEFHQFAQKNGGRTQEEMAERCPEKISRITISKALKRIGFTRKKLTVTEKEQNAHRADQIKQLIEMAGCSLVFLPAYSPDLNAVEKFWARLKNHLRKSLHQFEDLQDDIDNAFRVLP